MKRLVLALAAALTLVATSGCVVVPARHRAVAVVEAPVYVEPAYGSPGVDWVWQVHPAYGWGWYHRDRGWHRGWR